MHVNKSNPQWMNSLILTDERESDVVNISWRNFAGTSKITKEIPIGKEIIGVYFSFY